MLRLNKMSSLIISYSGERTNYNYNYIKLENKASIRIALIFFQLKKIYFEIAARL